MHNMPGMACHACMASQTKHNQEAKPNTIRSDGPDYQSGAGLIVSRFSRFCLWPRVSLFHLWDRWPSMPSRRRSRKVKKQQRDQGLPHGILREPSTIRIQSGDLPDYSFSGKDVKQWFVKVSRGIPGFSRAFGSSVRGHRERFSFGGGWEGCFGK